MAGLALPGLHQIDGLIERPLTHRVGQLVVLLLHLGDAPHRRAIRIARCLGDLLDADVAIEAFLDVAP
jgi:hypothetical protein